MYSVYVLELVLPVTCFSRLFQSRKQDKEKKFPSKNHKDIYPLSPNQWEDLLLLSERIKEMKKRSKANEKNIKYKMTDWRKMDRQSPLRELELWEDYLHEDEIFKTKPSSYLRFFHCLVIYMMYPQEPSSFLVSNTVKLVPWFIKKKYIKIFFWKQLNCFIRTRGKTFWN